jgi:hypothetical protein
MFHDQIPHSPKSMLDPVTSLLDSLRNPQFGVKLLQMAIGRDAPKVEDLASYIPPNDDDIDTISTPLRSMDLGMPSQLVAVQRFLDYFICLTNNNALTESHIFNAVNWLLEKFNRSLFVHIFNLQTTTSKIFMRKILPASVNSGNTKLV